MQCPNCGEKNTLVEQQFVAAKSGVASRGACCTACQHYWKNVTDLLEQIAAKYHPEVPHKICKVCGGDSYHLASSVWGEMNPSVCRQCAVCPCCGSWSFTEGGGIVQCQVCGDHWVTVEEYEKKLMERRDNLLLRGEESLRIW